MYVGGASVTDIVGGETPKSPSHVNLNIIALLRKDSEQSIMMMIMTASRNEECYLGYFLLSKELGLLVSIGTIPVICF